VALWRKRPTTGRAESGGALDQEPPRATGVGPQPLRMVHPRSSHFPVFSLEIGRLRRPISIGRRPTRHSPYVNTLPYLNTLPYFNKMNRLFFWSSGPLAKETGRRHETCNCRSGSGILWFYATLYTSFLHVSRECREACVMPRVWQRDLCNMCERLVSQHTSTVNAERLASHPLCIVSYPLCSVSYFLCDKEICVTCVRDFCNNTRLLWMLRDLRHTPCVLCHTPCLTQRLVQDVWETCVTTHFYYKYRETCVMPLVYCVILLVWQRDLRCICKRLV